MNRQLDIEGNLRSYLGARKPTARYTSFDYCFNYFRSHHDKDALDQIASPSQLEMSCLHLGFYLASWGMLRGSADLLKRSVKHFAPLIEVIASVDSTVWEIDAHRYREKEWETLSNVKRQIGAALPEGASDTLVTKIMLGTFGCVPAFDSYFKRGFGVSSFGAKALLRIEDFYHENAALVDENRVFTIDFENGEPTNRHYTRAKVIDMIFFVEGGL